MVTISQQNIEPIQQYSMKRKSEQLTPNINRLLRKNKTVGYPKVKKQLRDPYSHLWSEIIVQKIVQELTQNVHQKIKIVAHQQLLSSIIQNCSQMAENLRHMICPQLHDQQDNELVIDQQPQRSHYDPICGFDKLVTIRNDFTNKTEQTSMLETKTRQFGLFQNYKKQQSQKNTNSSINSTTSNLIPLQSLNIKLPRTNSQKQNQKHQCLYRDRFYQNNLPTVNLNSRNNTQNSQNKKPDKKSNTSISLDPIKNQDYIFDYNGQKGTLSPSIFYKMVTNNASKQVNNVLKTTYRVFDTTINVKEEQKKKISLDKIRKSRLSNNIVHFNTNRIQKEIIKNPNIHQKAQAHSQILDLSALGINLNPNSNPNINLRSTQLTDQAQLMKNMLQANFKDRQVFIRPISRGGRYSKVL